MFVYENRYTFKSKISHFDVVPRIILNISKMHSPNELLLFVDVADSCFGNLCSRKHFNLTFYNVVIK